MVFPFSVLGDLLFFFFFFFFLFLLFVYFFFFPFFRERSFLLFLPEVPSPPPEFSLKSWLVYASCTAGVFTTFFSRLLPKWSLTQASNLWTSPDLTQGEKSI